MAEVNLDPLGRLVGLAVVPPARHTPDDGPPPRIDWGPLWNAAGADPARFRSTALRLIPPAAYDEQAAWVGTFPDRPDLTVRLEAAAFRGRPVWFRVLDERGAPEDGETHEFISLVLWGITALLAARNYRRGRCDTRGATRLAAATIGLYLAAWLLGGPHTAAFGGEVGPLAVVLGRAGVVAIFLTLAYLALEPPVRHRWSWRMVGWGRVLDGRWRDPIVGRDLLVGLLVGVGAMVAQLAKPAVAVGLGVPPPRPVAGLLGYTALPPMRVVLTSLTFAVFIALTVFLVAFLLHLILRKPWLAWPALAILMTLVEMSDWAAGGLAEFQIALAFGVVFGAASAIVMTRFGLLAYAFALATYFALLATPLTYDASSWYFGRGLLGAGILVGLAAFGFVTATGGQRLFRQGFFGDE
jgi:serine/threonine-protein kinase